MKIPELADKIIEKIGKPIPSEDVTVIIKALYAVIQEGIANPSEGKAAFQGLGTFVVKKTPEGETRVRFRSATESKSKKTKPAEE